MTELLKKMKFSNGIYRANKHLGYFPYFQLILHTRLKKKKAINIVVTGEAGEGKSYLSWTLARLLDKRFTINEIIYTYPDYMRLVRTLPMYWPIMLDEPSYVMGKRDWFKEVNKVLVQTMESSRFKVHPTIIPIINKSLLDKTIRDHLIQFQIIVKDRGKADVIRIQASQFDETIYHHYICELHYPLVDPCPTEYWQGKNRDNCLGCQKLKQCPTFRAQYERKKATIQDSRYEQAETEASYFESKAMTDKQLATMIYALKDKIVNDKGKLSAKLIRIVFLNELDIQIGHNRAYTIKELVKMNHQNEFL